MKTLFIINPVSGKGKGRVPMRMIKAIDTLYKEANVEFGIRIWDRPDSIDDLLEEAMEGDWKVIVAVGGDGTINEIGKRLVGTDKVLGIIPRGSGNGFARHLGISRRPREAVGQLLGAHVVKMDTGFFGGVPFMNAAGIGIDAEVAARFAKAKTRGIKTYVRLATKTFIDFKSFHCRMVVDDGREYEIENMLLVDIANGTEWGGGAKISPMSHVSDGWLEAIILKKTPIMKVPKLVRLLFEGRIYKHPAVKIIRGKKFEIYRAKAGNAHVDGEPIELEEKIVCEINEASVSILVPNKMTEV